MVYKPLVAAGPQLQLAMDLPPSVLPSSWVVPVWHYVIETALAGCCKPWVACPTAKSLPQKNAGVAVADRGFTKVEIQMRTNMCSLGPSRAVPPWTAAGRAIANGCDEGVPQRLFDDSPEVHANGGQGEILAMAWWGRTRAT